MTLVKICGLSTAETLAAAIAGGASHVGFVFYPPSPRHLAFDQAAALARSVPGHVTIVGVFVDPDDELLATAVRAGRLGAVQLHGNETPERCDAARAHGPVWKGVPVRTRADIAAAQAYRGHTSRIIFDAKPPPGAALPGGNGVPLDFALFRGLTIPMPWGLSGGLAPETVAEAVAITGAPLVDVSSGVEDAPGRKSSAKITAFLEASR